MPYRLKIVREVQREIERLPGNVRQRVKRAIAELSIDPRPAHATELEQELAGFWRIKIDTYRIIYTIDDDVILIEVIRVARRTPKTYLGLEGTE
jgi:mRNA interferase RelE/StbE